MDEPDKEALAALLNAKWEYMEQTERASAYGVLESFDELGAQGWELVTAHHEHGFVTGIFKRRTIT